jgi:DNA-binding MurR/RpiR family transcriptional regulator
MKQMIHPLRDDVFARLSEARPRLSPKMAQLSEYIIANYLKIPVMSTREVAAAAKVSLATVVRLPTLLGYDDFDVLRTSIQDRVNFDLTGVDRLRRLPGTSRSPAALLRRIIDRDSESLQALAHSFSEQQLESFSSALVKAERVTILGFRYVASLALYFAYALGKIRPNVFAWTHADSSLYDRARLLDKGDAIVVIAFPRYPSDMVNLARYARRQRARMLAITDSPLSPVLPLSDVALLAKASMLDFVGSLAAPAALINLVVSVAGMQMGQKAMERLAQLEEAAESCGTYVSPGGRTTLLERGKEFFWDALEGPHERTKLRKES